MVHVDHITSAHFRQGEGDVKTRLGLDLDERQNEVILFGAEAERTWAALQKLKSESS
jgi:hypothetical protein